MTTVDLERTLIKETQGLSGNALQEVVDFIRFMKFKERQVPVRHGMTQPSIQEELQMGEADSLVHLEQEFEHYKEIYPHE